MGAVLLGTDVMLEVLGNGGLVADLNITVGNLLCIVSSILRTGQLFLKVGQTETGGDTLLQNTTDTLVTLNYQYFFCAFFFGCNCVCLQEVFINTSD